MTADESLQFLSFYINYGNKTATNQRVDILTTPIIVLNIFEGPNQFEVFLICKKI